MVAFKTLTDLPELCRMCPFRDRCSKGNPDFVRLLHMLDGKPDLQVAYFAKLLHFLVKYTEETA